MNSPTSQVVEQAIAKQDAIDAGIIADDDKKDDKADEAADADKGKPEPKEGDKSTDDKGTADDKSDDDKKEDDEEGTFTADDALEVDAPKDDKPAAPTDAAGIQLSAAEQKYIVDNIGEPIVIKGFRGEGENVKEVEIKAYSPSDIPADFKFANDAQLIAAQNGFQRLENNAQQLLGKYRQEQSASATADFERRENEGIRADVADLQKEGRMPKFKVQPGAAGFDDDPAAKQMAEVLAVMTERNELYLKQYQQGRPYKHIGFAEAFDIWERSNPGKQAEKKADEDQKKEDDDRKRGSERSQTSRGMDGSNIVKPTIPRGTSTRDILNRIDALE